MPGARLNAHVLIQIEPVVVSVLPSSSAEGFNLSDTLMVCLVTRKNVDSQAVHRTGMERSPDGNAVDEDVGIDVEERIVGATLVFFREGSLRHGRANGDQIRSLSSSKAPSCRNSRRTSPLLLIPKCSLWGSTLQ
jgi:hypothetical protein